MPSTLLDRLPLPSLRTYTTISVLLFSCSVYYALQVTLEPGWSLNITENAKPQGNSKEDSILSSVDTSRLLLHKMLISNAKTKKLYEMMYVLVEEPLCVWVSVQHFLDLNGSPFRLQLTPLPPLVFILNHPFNDYSIQITLISIH